MSKIDWDEFVRERDEALLSLDREKIEAYCRKYESPIAPNEQTFWTSVHMARTLATSLPEEERQKSTTWLRANGHPHWGWQS